MITRCLLTILFLALSLSSAAAKQSLSVRPDGTVTFKVSLTGITRVAIEGDRIRRLVNNGSNFETTNDEETGDLFIRFVGESFVPETGFLITESGATVNYKLASTSSASETVVIKIIGGAKAAEAGAVGGGISMESGPSAVGGAGNGHEADIAAFLKRTWRERIGRRAAKGSGQVDTFSAGGLRARILVTRGGAQGGVVSAQSYYTPRVVAVLVEHPKLGPNQSSWVIVVEQK